MFLSVLSLKLKCKNLTSKNQVFRSFECSREWAVKPEPPWDFFENNWCASQYELQRAEANGSGSTGPEKRRLDHSPWTAHSFAFCSGLSFVLQDCATQKCCNAFHSLSQLEARRVRFCIVMFFFLSACRKRLASCHSAFCLVLCGTRKMSSALGRTLTKNEPQAQWCLLWNHAF